MNARGDTRSHPWTTSARTAHGTATTAGAPVRTSAQARTAVRRALAGYRPAWPAQVDDLLLVASELVTNAERHAGGVTGFAVRVGRGSVTVSVDDASRRTPHRTRHGEPGQELVPGGYGWPIVLHLCRTVTVDLRPDGKTVHAVVPLERRAGRP
ncbi:ATP-binding protein [Streptomyces sp. NPDC053493]|uniref:ATP-binding protein n=1 Tax=Streptomyces sp. NPDC053493 TaxID=3365705 RepID=UPI0037D14E0D